MDTLNLATFCKGEKKTSSKKKSYSPNFFESSNIPIASKMSKGIILFYTSEIFLF